MYTQYVKPDGAVVCDCFLLVQRAKQLQEPSYVSEQMSQVSLEKISAVSTNVVKFQTKTAISKSFNALKNNFCFAVR